MKEFLLFPAVLPVQPVVVAVVVDIVVDNSVAGVVDFAADYSVDEAGIAFGFDAGQLLFLCLPGMSCSCL